MKKILKFASLCLFTATVLTSCEEDVVTYDSKGGTGLAGFDAQNVDFAVGDVGVQELLVEVNVSNKVNSERTMEVTVDPVSTALAEEYSLDISSLVIPANSYEGYVKIVGNFEAIPLGVMRSIILNLESVEDAVINEQADQVTVTMFAGCALPDGFLVGDYLFEEVTPYVDGPTLEDGTVRTISVTPGNPFGRVFSTFTYPQYCASTRVNFTFLLICGEVIASSANQGNCVCQSGVPFMFGPATVNETYNEEDDSVVYLTFTNDVTSNCGPPTQTTYKLTKQE